MRGRFAPSPTGDLHLGNARTALLAWLQVRSAGGRFLIRMEDLDRGRVRPHFYDSQLADLRWLGIDWDEPFRVQNLLSGETHLWNGSQHRLWLDPHHEPALFFALSPWERVDYVEGCG